MKVVSLGVTTTPFPNTKANKAVVGMLEEYLEKAKRGEIEFVYLMYQGEEIGCELEGVLPDDPYQTMGYMHEMIQDFRAHYDMG